ncbi:MAG: nodulation protein NfeD [Actinobacteria bacterium]|nr:nodulation protein NfeD [Actinomycetota bacterium]
MAGCFLVAAAVLAGAAPAGAQQARSVLVAEVADPITPVTADYLSEGVARAGAQGFEAFVIELDTPGGLDSSMRRIAQSIISSEVPVVVYVSPRGARAASAGAIITMSAHVAAMAPGTAIGASTPVELEGGDVSDKVINDAAAYAESLARLRDRNVEFAREMVTEGRSVPVTEALEIGAVDFIADSLSGLLEQIDGVEVTLAEEQNVTLATAGASVERHDLGFLRGIQKFLADPNLVFLFFSLGTLAIVYELASPGIGVGGVLGAILLVLALFATAVLPVTAAGLALLGVAVALFAAELYAPGIGIAAAGGTVALVLAGVFLFRNTPGVGVGVGVLVPVAVLMFAAVVLAGRLVVKARFGKVAIGQGHYEGMQITVKRADGKHGQAMVDGAWWKIVSADRDLVEGEPVRVVGQKDLELQVEPIDETGTEENTGPKDSESAGD